MNKGRWLTCVGFLVLGLITSVQGLLATVFPFFTRATSDPADAEAPLAELLASAFPVVFDASAVLLAARVLDAFSLSVPGYGDYQAAHDLLLA